MTEAYDKAENHKKVVWRRCIGIHHFFQHNNLVLKYEGRSQVQIGQKEMSLHTARWKHEKVLDKGESGCKNSV